MPTKHNHAPDSFVHWARRYDYEPSVPRCATCIYFTGGAFRGRNTKPPRCQAQQQPMAVSQSGVCKRWRSQAGETLECAN